MLNSMQEGRGPSEESDGFRPKPLDKVYSIFKMTGPASQFWLLESAPGLRSSTLSKVHHCTLSLRVLHPKVRVLQITPFVNNTKTTISCDKLSIVSNCSYKSFYIKNNLSVWLRPPYTTSLLFYCILYLYSIFVRNRCNFHHREIERKYLLRNFSVLFLQRKNHPCFIFSIASRTIILSFWHQKRVVYHYCESKGKVDWQLYYALLIEATIMESTFLTF